LDTPFGSEYVEVARRNVSNNETSLPEFVFKSRDQRTVIALGFEFARNRRGLSTTKKFWAERGLVFFVI